MAARGGARQNGAAMTEEQKRTELLRKENDRQTYENSFLRSIDPVGTELLKLRAQLDEARLALALMRRTLELIADGEGNPDLLARRTLHTLREGAWEDKP